MKKLLLIATVFFSTLTSFAELNGDGYYRVQNAFTKRYIYIMDNRGSYDVASTSADVGAIELYLDVARKNSDPATILYLENASGSFYDIASQGTSLHGLLDSYVKIYKSSAYEGILAYNIYASKSGMTKYLSDRRTSMTNDKGMTSVDKTDAERRLWYVTPIDCNGEEFFGIAPTVTSGGKYFHPFFAGFPVSAKSEGVKFYVVTDVDPVGVAVVKEVTGTIPAGVPVIVECANPLATDNRLNVGVFSDNGDISGNQLSAVYFDNDNESVDHWNRTAFDRNAMRVLGEKEGKLAFVRADYDYIPRNQAYLPLNDASLQDIDDFVVMTPEELVAYKEWLNENSVDIIPADSAVDVYGIDGRLVKEGISKSDVPSIGKGLYILRSGNRSEKIVLK